MKGVVAEGDELMPHRCYQATPCTRENNRPEAEVPMATQSTPISHPDPKVLVAAQTPIKKLCRNRGLVLQDEKIASSEKVMEETAPAYEAMEEKMAATVPREVMKDKMVQDTKEIHLTYKRRRLFEDD